MNIVIVGTGYVGLVTGACFARVGNRVTCIDIDPVKVQSLARGEVPFYEPGLGELVRHGGQAGCLSFSLDLRQALSDAEIVFLTVGTPTDARGGSDLTGVWEAARGIGAALDHPLIVVTKSTVPVGTTEVVGDLIREELQARGVSARVALVSNPEFLKEGAAVEDFQNPDRVVVGTDDAEAAACLKRLYAPFLSRDDQFLPMDIRSSELTKYAANAMLATRISFMNEVANLCEAVGANVSKIKAGIAADPRIGPHFLNPGTGFGGSCFPKDLRALIRTAEACGLRPRVLEAVAEVNSHQKSVLVRKVTARFGEDLEGLAFAVWGLAFKPETDDLREAPSLVIIRELVARGARVRAYDPQAMPAALVALADLGDAVGWAETKEEALREADALLLVTEWQEFHSPDFAALARMMRQPVLFDGRNQYLNAPTAEAGLEYHPIGARVGSARERVLS